MAGKRDIVIIGGGVVGCCTAWYAMQRGFRVTVVERGGPDHEGCSLGNGGMIVPSHFVPLAAPGMVAYGLRMMLRRNSPFAIRPRPSRDLLRWGWLFMRAANAGHVARAAPILRDLHIESRRCYIDLEGHIGDFGLARHGLLMLCRSERGLREETETAHLACRLDVPAEVLGPDDAALVEPGLGMDIAGAVYYPRDAYLSPGIFMAKMVRALESGGVRFLWRTEVQGFRARDGRIESVQTGAGDLAADEFVLAAGSWSGQMARGFGLTLPLQAGKGYSMTLPAPRQLPRTCAILSEARVAVTPMGVALRFAGTLEIAGLDTTTNIRRVQGIRDSVPRYLPAFSADDFQGAPVWAGLRPCSPDGLPYIGRTARYANLLIGTGHAMMGMSLGPVTGKLLAEMASGEAPAMDSPLLHPDRYD